jgi:hypothetical protein
VFIEDVQQRMDDRWHFDCRVHNMLEGPVASGSDSGFDGAYALDVLEHIPPEHEHRFLSNMVQSLHQHGTLIIGMPSIQSQAYASAPSKEGHVNCKDGNNLKAVLHQHFHNVFVFSMNDEVIHTGFYPMAHYLLALCCTRK